MNKYEVSLKELIRDCEKIWGSPADRRFIRIIYNGAADIDKITKELDKKGIIYLVDSQEKSIRESYSIDLNKIKIVC